MATPAQVDKVQTFGRKKTAVAVALVKSGKGNFRVNGLPLDQLTPEILRTKVYEPLLMLGKGKEGETGKWGSLDFKVRVKGGGYVSQIYAVRQAISRGIIAYNQKYVDEATKKDIRDTLSAYDKTLVVSDPRRCEPKKFGGRGARARFQKSYR